MLKGLLAKAASSKQAKLDHERLTSLVNSMADGVLAVDKTMHIVLSNGAALNILDVNSTLKGHKLGGVVKIQDKNKHRIDIEKLVTEATRPTTSRDYLLVYS